MTASLPRTPSALDRIRLVLVRPHSPGNVGSVARIMMNFGLHRLVLAELPDFRDPEFFPRESRKMAWKASPLLDSSLQFPDLAAALGGTHLALGTAPRSLPGAPLLTPREGARQLLEAARSGQEVALVFGGEADGLRNQEHALVHGMIRIPTSEAYTDLNLAQSAAVCGYELFLAHLEAEEQLPPPRQQPEPAEFDSVRGLLGATRELLTESGFLQGPRPDLVEELERVVGRARLSEREVRIFRGVVRQLAWALGHQRK